MKKQNGSIDEYIYNSEDRIYTIKKDGYQREIKNNIYKITKIYGDTQSEQMVKEGYNKGKITHEEKEGYYFIGFSDTYIEDINETEEIDEDYCNNLVYSDFSNVTSDMTVYPFYISKNYLKLRTYIRKNKNTSEIIFISLWSNLPCKVEYIGKFGFSVSYNDKVFNYEDCEEASTISMNSASTGEVVSSWTTFSAFETNGNIEYTIFSDLDQVEYNTEIKIQPYIITHDGTKVLGQERTYLYTGYGNTSKWLD